jgi:hypothetical protein
LDYSLEVFNNIKDKENFNLATQESKMDLAQAMLKVPQKECAVVHRFGPGVYIREAIYPPNVLIVGLEHVGEHINVLLKGKINVIDGNGAITYMEAPHMFVAQAGSKVGYTLEEVVWQNIYSTTETDIEVLEKTLFKTPPLFDKYLSDKLEKEIPEHEEDRQDFERMLLETGWKKEDVEYFSHYREDCIPFSYGSYPVCPGKSPIQGKGLFSTAPIKEGQLIAPMRLFNKRTPAGYLVNHAKVPNAKAVLLPNNDLLLVALRDIHGMLGGCLGEEITLDYRQVMKLNNLWDGEIKCLPD